MRIVVEVVHSFGASSLTNRLTFYRELARIDFEAVVDWREPAGPEVGVPCLKVGFTPDLAATEVWAESPFAAVSRAANGQEAPMLRWVDVGNADYGVALLNDSKYGYDALGSRVRLTLLRTGYEPDADSDSGHHTIRYSLLPHAGSWSDAGVPQAAAGFNQPLLPVPAAVAGEPAEQRPRPVVHGLPTVMSAALKQAHAGAGVVLRLYESGGRSGTVTVGGVPAGWQATEVTIVEDQVAPFGLVGRGLELAFSPWQVRSLLLTPPGN